MGLFGRIKSAFSKKRPITLGLALGSGGAKGLAHIGALKAFEEEGISFQIVTGTSIGAIVGALYAKGYTSADMFGIIESLNRKEFSSNLIWKGSFLRSKNPLRLGRRTARPTKACC